MATIFTSGQFQAIGNDGKVVPYGKLYFYEAGTLTPVNSYTTALKDATNTIPVVISASGKADVFLDEGVIDIVLKDSLDVVVWTIENYKTSNTFDNTGTGLAATNNQEAIEEINVKLNGSILNPEYKIDTIADLRLMTELPSTVWVTGYHTANDGAFGSHFFKKVTDTGQVDNGGTIIRTVNGVYELQYDGAVNVKWFGAIGDNDNASATINTSAIQSAVLANSNVSIGLSSDMYAISGSINIPSEVTISSTNATIRQTIANAPIFKNETVGVQTEDITITNTIFIGLETDYTNNSGATSDGIRFDSTVNLSILNCKFSKFAHSALYVYDSSGIVFENNTILGLTASLYTPYTDPGGCTGVAVISSSFINISNNTISGVNIGIQTGSYCTDVIVSDNHIGNILGQHAMYFGAAQINLIISGNTINTVDLVGIKVQQYDTPAQVSMNVSLIGNNIRNTGANGIEVLSSTAGALYLLDDINIIGNNIYNSGQDGINIKYLNFGIVSGNVVNSTTREGISFSFCTNTHIKENIIYNTGTNGIRDIGLSTYCSITGNDIKNPARLNTASQEHGILIVAADELIISNNSVIDTLANMQYGFMLQSSNQDTFTFRNNYTAGATNQGLRSTATTLNFRYFGENNITGLTSDTTGVLNENQRGTLRLFYSTAVPSTGTWQRGDIVYNTLPVAGGNIGWVCTTAGTPGTWKSFGTIGA